MSWLSQLFGQGKFPHRPQRGRLRTFESLESRYCLAAPAISGLSVAVGAGHYVQVSGYVSDESPGEVQVAINGVVSGLATTESSGHFYFYGSTSTLGTITATAMDIEQLTSSPVSVELSSQPPAVTITSVDESGDGQFAVIQGVIQDENPSTCEVNFSGVASGGVTANYDGTFTAYVSASALGQINAVVTDEWGLQGNSASVLTSDAPLVTAVSATTTSSGKYVIVSGQVSDETAGAATVSLSGVASGMYSVNPDGSFWAFIYADSLGNVTVTATDVWGQVSNAVIATLTDAPPVLSGVMATEGEYPNSVYITGQVVDADPSSVTVSLGGVVSGTTTVDSNGSFAIWTNASDLGQITVQATDIWGQTSSVVTTQLSSAPPTVSNFTVRQEVGNWWVVEGKVTDDIRAAGLIVTFGGVLQGSSAIVREDGTFSYGFYYSGSTNVVTAVVYDWWGLSSNTASYIIQ